MSSPTEMSTFQRNLRVLTSGALAGAISRTMTAPIERIKVLLQTNNKHYADKNIFRCLLYMYKNEGLTALFKGNRVNVIRVVPFSALEFFTFDYIRYRILMGSPLTMKKSLIIGAIAGMVSSTFTYPLDLITTLLTIQVLEKKYQGIGNTFISVVKKEGIRGLYRGWNITLMGIVPFISIKMTTYNFIKFLFYNEHDKTPFLPSLLFGAMAATTAATFTYPCDLIKRRLQMKSLNDMEEYKGLIDCIQKIWCQEGLRGFYLGLTACYIKVIPSTAIASAMNNYCRKQLGIQIENNSS